MEIGFLNRFFERIMIFVSVISLSFGILSFFSGNIFDYVLPFIFCVVYTLIMEFSMTSKITFGLHLWFFILAGAVAAFFCRMFSYTLTIFYVIPACLFEYVACVAFFKVYVIHDDFEEQCEGKERQVLQTELFNNRFISEDFLAAARGLKHIMLISGGILLLVITLLNIIHAHVSTATYIYVFVYLFSIFIHGQLLNQYRKEIYFAFLGLEAIFLFRGITLVLAVGIALACLAAGFLLSTNYALLKPDYFSWLFKFFHTDTPMQTGEQKIVEIPVFDPTESELAEFLAAQTNENPIFGKILNILGIAIVASLFFYFMIRPIWATSWRQLFSGKNISLILEKVKQSFIEILKNLLNLRKHKTPYASTQGEIFKATMSDFLKTSKKSRQKRAELDRLTAIFMDLIEWGEQNGFTYTPNLAPAEYAQLIKLQDARDAGNIFEKALYSETLLSKEEEQEFKDKVHKVIS